MILSIFLFMRSHEFVVFVLSGDWVGLLEALTELWISKSSFQSLGVQARVFHAKGD